MRTPSFDSNKPLKALS